MKYLIGACITHNRARRIRFLDVRSLHAEANLFCATIVLRCTPIFDRATINRFRLNSKRLPGRTSSVIETCNWFCMLRRYTKRWNGTHTSYRFVINICNALKLV